MTILFPYTAHISWNHDISTKLVVESIHLFETRWKRFVTYLIKHKPLVLKTMLLRNLLTINEKVISVFYHKLNKRIMVLLLLFHSVILTLQVYFITRSYSIKFLVNMFSSLCVSIDVIKTMQC